MNNNPKRPVKQPGGLGSILRYIVPYLMIFAIIIIAWQALATPQDPNIKNVKLADTDLLIMLEDRTSRYDFVKIEYNKETFDYIQGVFIDNETPASPVTYAFTTETDQITFEKSLINPINARVLFEDTEGRNGVIKVPLETAINIWAVVFSYLPFILLGFLVIFLLVKFSGGANASNNKAFDFGKSPARSNEASNIRFTDVAGLDEEKQEVVEIIDYLKNPAKYTKMGAKMPKGILLKGAPGTGKTLLAKAVAGEAGVPFYSISGSDFVEMFVGVGASRVRDLFKKAKNTAPCIIFIDEIDAVGRQRGTGLGGGHDEREQTLNQLLVEMDGFGENSGVVVIAATNRDDVLDPALLRPGRFDRSIIVSLPDRKGREAILKVHARNKRISPNVNFDNLARRTPGFSGAELANILNEAAILTVREDKTLIETHHIDEAIDRVVGGTAKKSRVFTPHERKMVAYHEAGHTVIGLKLSKAEVVQKVTIIPRGDAAGYVMMTPEDDRFLQTKGELLETITGLLAGRVSEEIFFQDVTTGAHNDIERATRIARTMVTQLGMSSLGPIQYENNAGSVFLGRDYNNAQRNFSSQIAFEIDREVRSLIDECYEQAKKIILENKDTLILIAETLLKQETLNREEINYLVEHGHLVNQEPIKVDTPVEDVKSPLQTEFPPLQEDKPKQE